jgi:hypothetical protein
MTNFQSTDGGLSVAVLANKHALVAAGTATFVGVDLIDYIGEVKVILSSFSPVTDGSTTLQGALLHSADNTTFVTWADAPTFSAITAATATQTVSLDTRKCSRYVQFRHIATGTTATFTHSCIAVGRKQSQ